VTSELGMPIDAKKDCFSRKSTLLVSGGSILRFGGANDLPAESSVQVIIVAILPASSKLHSPSNSDHTHFLHMRVDTAHLNSAINLGLLINGRQFGIWGYRLLRVRHIGVYKAGCATPRSESGAEKLHDTNKYKRKGKQYSPVISSRVILVNRCTD